MLVFAHKWVLCDNESCHHFLDGSACKTGCIINNVISDCDECPYGICQIVDGDYTLLPDYSEHICTRGERAIHC